MSDSKVQYGNHILKYQECIINVHKIALANAQAVDSSILLDNTIVSDKTGKLSNMKGGKFGIFMKSKDYNKVPDKSKFFEFLKVYIQYFQGADFVNLIKEDQLKPIYLGQEQNTEQDQEQNNDDAKTNTNNTQQTLQGDGGGNTEPQSTPAATQQSESDIKTKAEKDFLNLIFEADTPTPETVSNPNSDQQQQNPAEQSTDNEQVIGYECSYMMSIMNSEAGDIQDSLATRTKGLWGGVLADLRNISIEIGGQRVNVGKIFDPAKWKEAMGIIDINVDTVARNIENKIKAENGNSFVNARVFTGNEFKNLLNSKGRLTPEIVKLIDKDKMPYFVTIQIYKKDPNYNKFDQKYIAKICSDVFGTAENITNMNAIGEKDVIKLPNCSDGYKYVPTWDQKIRRTDTDNASNKKNNVKESISGEYDLYIISEADTNILQQLKYNLGNTITTLRIPGVELKQHDNYDASTVQDIIKRQDLNPQSKDAQNSLKSIKSQLEKNKDDNGIIVSFSKTFEGQKKDEPIPTVQNESVESLIYELFGILTESDEQSIVSTDQSQQDQSETPNNTPDSQQSETKSPEDEFMSSNVVQIQNMFNKIAEKTSEQLKLKKDALQIKNVLTAMYKEESTLGESFENFLFDTLSEAEEEENGKTETINKIVETTNTQLETSAKSKFDPLSVDFKSYVQTSQAFAEYLNTNNINTDLLGNYDSGDIVLMIDVKCVQDKQQEYFGICDGIFNTIIDQSKEQVSSAGGTLSVQYTPKVSESYISLISEGNSLEYDKFKNILSISSDVSAFQNNRQILDDYTKALKDLKQKSLNKKDENGFTNAIKQYIKSPMSQGELDSIKNYIRSKNFVTGSNNWLYKNVYANVVNGNSHETFTKAATTGANNSSSVAKDNGDIERIEYAIMAEIVDKLPKVQPQPEHQTNDNISIDFVDIDPTGQEQEKIISTLVWDWGAISDQEKDNMIQPVTGMLQQRKGFEFINWQPDPKDMTENGKVSSTYNELAKGNVKLEFVDPVDLSNDPPTQYQTIDSLIQYLSSGSQIEYPQDSGVQHEGYKFREWQPHPDIISADIQISAFYDKVPGEQPTSGDNDNGRVIFIRPITVINQAAPEDGDADVDGNSGGTFRFIFIGLDGNASHNDTNQQDGTGDNATDLYVVYHKRLTKQSRPNQETVGHDGTVTAKTSDKEYSPND